MTTRLERFSDAYASMVVAVYEPLLLRWFSGQSLRTVARTLSARRGAAKFDDAISTADAVNRGRAPADVPWARGSVTEADTVAPPPATIDDVGARLPENAVRRLSVPGFPDAVTVAGRIIPHGLLEVRPAGELGADPAEFSEFVRSPRTVATLFDPAIRSRQQRGQAATRAFLNQLLTAARSVVADPALSLTRAVSEIVEPNGGFHFLPEMGIEEAFAPIGIAHFFRQLYFNVHEGVGPLEQALTVAPLETLEVLYESTRRQTYEEEIQHGTESVTEESREERQSEEISDKVANMVQRDQSAAVSASASFSFAAWSGSASIDLASATSSQRQSEEASRRLKEVTRRASERITKSFSIKTRSVEETTTTNLSRRIIRNESTDPVSYGLRRVLRRVNVKVQDLGPRLVWQTYVRDPGEGLAKSKLVQFAEAQPISSTSIPPGVRPEPKGGIDTGSQVVLIQTDSGSHNDNVEGWITLGIHPGRHREIRAILIDAINDLESGGDEDEVAVPIGPPGPPVLDLATGAYSVTFKVRQGDTQSVQVDFSYVWEPSQLARQEWENERKQALSQVSEMALVEQFERQRALITMRSRVRARPAADLRREERFEILGRLTTQLFSSDAPPTEPSPVEIETFHRMFEVEDLFAYAHPSWWRPHYSSPGGGPGRRHYEITAESDPAPMGASLGWEIQADGDARRNELLNSPWARVCIPIKPGREREALQWLARHAEGSVGFDPVAGPVAELLRSIEDRRRAEATAGAAGPDWVTVTATPGAPRDPATPEGVYPIVSEFEVTVPTEGFVYERLEIG